MILFSRQRACRLGNVVSSQTELLQELCRRARVSERIVDTDTADRNGTSFRERSADRFAKSTDDVMLLYRLIVAILITRVLMPSAARRFPASIASGTRIPVAMTATSVPSCSTSPLPTTKGKSSAW